MKYTTLTCTRIIALFLLGGWFLISCSENKQALLNPLFKVRTAEQTGINFSNALTPTPQFNLLSYMYYYNGAGLGAGDFNNDGLTDLFFSSNQGDNKLYLNKGSLQFTDVTAAARIPQDKGWSTGVSVVDINNDGLLDIYVCKVGHYKVLHGKNQLLICTGISKDGVPTYRDEASAYGLDFSGFSTQAAFLDYDGDGDLDMFLLNHSVNHDGNYAPRQLFANTFDSLAGQKMFQNNNGHFSDITETCGINGSRIGYGLGVAVADINLDGWPDIYVGNDFHENDYLYINQRNGTFKDETANRLMHTSQFTMGVDVADVNNDAFPEIISMDMLPYDPYMIRRSLAEDDYNIFQQKIAYGYNYQYARNNMQVNRTNGMFSEAGQYAGVYATDWSWAALWMDFNNDGNKDLFVSNGIPKRMNDIDYINFISSEEVQQKLQSGSMADKDISLVNKFPEIKIPNQFFVNKGNFTFSDMSDSIAGNLPAFSNGAVYADLDNDGDLDIVVNNINDKVMLYENAANDQHTKAFARVDLKGPAGNITAEGARVILYANGGLRTYEHTSVHGFQSSMLLPLHIGLDKTTIDSAFVIWPDNSFESIRIAPNQPNVFTYKAGLPKFDFGRITTLSGNNIPAAEDITLITGLHYQHTENRFNEFDREPLLPHMLSTEGPALAVADINHDGREDIFIGSSKGNHNAVYLQTASGKFTPLLQPDLLRDSMWENVAAEWIDVNNDTHPDLLIASGGNEYYGKDQHLLPLLYLNDGRGNLTKKADAFAGIDVTQSVIASCDFNQDGAIDVFIGGRTEPWNYGAVPRSYLLQNDGSGKFTDVTAAVAKELLHPGMVTDARWIDMNRDGNKDLLLTYEWGGIDIFINNKNGFRRTVVTQKNGWWNFALPCDIDNDGDMDLVAGNLGLNTKLKASAKEPVSMYFGDFDDNGKNEQILTYFLKGTEIPFGTKSELEKKLPYIKKKYLYAEDFAKASLVDLFGAAKLEKTRKFSADYFSNALLINNGEGQFEVEALPYQAQFSSYRDAIVADVNNDSLPDIILAGNYYDCNVEIGRCDGDFGSVLINKGKGRLMYSQLNGLTIKGQVRHIRPIQINKQQAFLMVRNNDQPVVLRFK